jgi:ribulose bisphosphate carboxylase small subunit
MLQFKSANGSRASRRWAKSGKAEHISKEMSSLKVYRASRWSAIGLIGDPRPKTVLDDGRLSHGSVYVRLIGTDLQRPGKRRQFERYVVLN